MVSFKDLALIQEHLILDQKLLVGDFNNRIRIIEYIRQIICENRDEKCKEDKNFFNKFFGEVKPLQLLINYTTAISIKVTSGKKDKQNNQDNQIDAVVIDSTNNEINIECTLAFDGYQRQLQHEHMEKYRYTSPFNEVKAISSKASKKREIIQQDPDMVSKDSLKSKLTKLLKKSIDNKINKNNKSYQDAWLLVTFLLNDYLSLTDEADVAGFSRKELSQICQTALPESLSPFDKIFFLGYEDKNKESFMYHSGLHIN